MTLDYTFAVVAAGCLLIGVASGVAGSFALLRRQSLLGDVVAHCALPGVVAAFLFVGQRDLPLLLLGALVSGVLGAYAVFAIQRWTRLDADAALGIVLSTFFGVGVAMLSYAQHASGAAQAGLQSFLFGQAATMLYRDVLAIAAYCGVLLSVTALFWKEWLVCSFDRDFAASMGLSTIFFDGLLLLLIVAAIVVGLQAVGAVLMSAMLVAPAVAARQWVQRFLPMTLLAAAIGSLCGMLGVALTDSTVRSPTGPTIILLATLTVVLSLLLGSDRGALWRYWRRQKARRGLLADQLLLAFYQIAVQHKNVYEVRELALIDRQSLAGQELKDLLDVLADRGWVRLVDRRKWAFSPAGFARARGLAQRSPTEPTLAEADAK